MKANAFALTFIVLNNIKFELIPKELKRCEALLVKINPTRVVSLEVRITISCDSRFDSANFSCAILDHFINSFGIIIT
jgi:hypothetical protein